jgi:trehalose-6-phosphatase
MIISCDFDGTLCEHKFPEIGKADEYLIKKLIKLRKEGHQVILWTCREGDRLREAIKWCRRFGLEFDAINENVYNFKNQDFAIRKPYADIYLDDRFMTVKDFLVKGE